MAEVREHRRPSPPPAACCVALFAAVAFCAVSENDARGADAAACPDVQLRIDAPVDSAWREAIDHLCADLESLRDRDTSAGVRVRTDGGQGVVTVSLLDGRVTERRVRSPADLRATVEALITLPPTPSEEPARVPSPLPIAPTQLQPSVVTTTTPKHEPVSATAIEVGAAVVGRLARSPTYVSTGASAYAGMHSESWLLALSIRWLPIENVLGHSPPGFEMDSAGAGFIAARRFDKNPSFDVGATAWVVELTQSYGPNANETSRSHTELHLGLLARVLLGSGPWRESIALDAEVAPGRFRQDTRLDPVLPTLPTWSLGLALGATWEDQ
jgi:hypothetical protein